MTARTDNTILLTNGNGRPIVEGIVSGTPKPGTIMQIKAATEPVNGKFTFEVYNRAADGDRPQGPHYILLEDNLQGKEVTDAYVTGTRCFLHALQPGDEVLALVANIAGTGDSFAIGDLLIVDDGTGKLIATTGSPECEPFMVAETMAALTADDLVHCIYTGY